MKKLLIQQSKQQSIDDSKWRLYEEVMLSKDIKYHNDPKVYTNTLNPSHITDYLFPRERSRSRSNSGAASLKPLIGDSYDKSRSMSPTATISPLSLMPPLSMSPSSESTFKRKISVDGTTNSPTTEDNMSSKSSAYDSSSDDEEVYMSHLNPPIANEIPNGFMSTKMEHLKEFLKEVNDDMGATKKNVNISEYKTWKKEHSILEFLTDELLNTQDLKTKMFPFLFNTSDSMKDGSSDLLLQSFDLNKQDIDNRAKLIIDVEKFKLDFVEEYLGGMPLEQFYGSITLYSTNLNDGSNPFTGIKRYSETFTFSFSSTTNSKRVLFYLCSQNLPNFTGQRSNVIVIFL